MAQIDISTLKRIEKNRYVIQEKVYATYSSFNDCGEHYLQIDTYGRSNREMPDKLSQSIQLDKETAFFIYNLLKKEFEF